VSAIESAHQLESVLVARRLAAIAALLRHRSAADGPESETDYSTVDGFD
jgi:hypothetical protein